MNQNLNLTFYQKEIDAEKTIIEIANEVYTSLDLKPISKTSTVLCATKIFSSLIIRCQKGRELEPLLGENWLPF